MRLALVVVVVAEASRPVPSLSMNISKKDLPPIFLIPPLCGSRLRAWSSFKCAGALDIFPGEDIWVSVKIRFFQKNLCR